MAKNKDVMVQISARISAEEKEMLEQRAEELDSTLSYVIRQAIKQYLSK